MSTSSVRRRYEFIKANQHEYGVKPMCRLWCHTQRLLRLAEEPISSRAQDDARLLRLIRASFVASHGIYGAPRVFLDLREAGETRNYSEVR